MTRIRRQTCTAGNAIGHSQRAAGCKNFTNFWRRSEADGKRRRRRKRRGTSQGSWGTGTGVTGMQPKRGGGKGRGRSVEMEKHSFSQKEEGREEAFNDGQNTRSTNLLDRQTIF